MPAVIDAVLMGEHLSAHEVAIHKLEKYLSWTRDSEIREMIAIQGAMMRHHVETMLRLLQGKPATLPALPTGVHAAAPSAVAEPVLSDRDIALDCRMTAAFMGMDNLQSAEHMADEACKRVHREMAQQDGLIAARWLEAAERRGWSHHESDPRLAQGIGQKYAYLDAVLSGA